MKRLITTTVIIASLMAAPVMARSNSHVDSAKVTNVEPIVETVEIQTPQRSCWTETVAYKTPRHGYQSHTGTILGTLIGGAIGNAVGHSKTNKKVGTVAGAILGGTIGRDMSRSDNRYSKTEYVEEERCEVTHDVSYKDRIIGYDVTYKYRGKTYHTQMDTPPGKRIKVAVDVRPIY